MGIIDGVATILLTYGAHSLAMCAIALLGARFIRRPHDRDVVWKTALIAPIMTTTIAIALSANGVHSPFVDLARLARHASPAQLPGRLVRVRVLKAGDESRVDRSFSDPVTTALSTGAVIAALLVVGIASTRLAVRRRRLSRAVADRREFGELALGNLGTALLSSSSSLQTPVALSRAEICLPDDVVHQFAERHQRSLIAHEVAHLERRDPAWFFATEVIAALSSFQPLVITVVRAFRRDVELICDEAAVHRTHDQHSLIGALALLASPFDPRSPLHGAATAYDGSPLVGRAERIASLQPGGAAPRVATPICIAVAASLAMLCALPVVSAAPRLTDIPLDPAHAAASPGFKRVLNVDEVATTRGVQRTVTIFH